RASLRANEGDAPEGAACGAGRVSTREATGHQLVDSLLQVKLDLVCEFAIDATAREEIADRTKRVHGFTGVRTSLIPSSICSKLDTSRSRCFLPVGVSW